ncbi:MAG: rhodanese-like domain-containing protein [Candidatus Binatia bacterium]
MIKQIAPNDTAELMASGGWFAVFDVRERGEYNDGQIPYATSLPRSQIEFRIDALVPNRKIPIVVYDEGGSRAQLAANTLADLGYRDVAILRGGLDAWKNQRRETVSGVNVPSKAFGERVHHERAVPDLSPEELKSLLDSNSDLTILDVRTPEEYGRFCIPGGINVPGGELILWAEQLRNKPAVIVNCAGRTRSIIGAAALRRLGLTNVRALRNGTMGWVLAGYELETKPARRGGTPASAAQTVAAARQIADDEKLAWTTPEKLSDVTAHAADGVNYIIDVRSEAEFAAGHIDGALNVPGGQAVQRADDFVPVRNGWIVFVSNQSARAVMAAYWYGQMGFKHVSVLQGGLEAWLGSGGKLVSGVTAAEPLGFDSAKRCARTIDATKLRQVRSEGLLILDVSTSLEYESAHIPGAKWICRGWIDIKLPELFPARAQPIVLTCADGRQSIFAARQLAQFGYSDVQVLDGGVRGWTAAGIDIAAGLDNCLVKTNDVVLSPSIRGSKEDMLNYLNWELKLKH